MLQGFAVCHMQGYLKRYYGGKIGNDKKEVKRIG